MGNASITVMDISRSWKFSVKLQIGRLEVPSIYERQSQFEELGTLGPTPMEVQTRLTGTNLSKLYSEAYSGIDSRWIFSPSKCHFLAVQNSSIGLIACPLLGRSVGPLPLTIKAFTTLQSDPRDL